MYIIEKFSLPRANLESRGQKYKFWCQNPNGNLFLFKEGREFTGENWAEVVAFQISKLINLPSASYILAEWSDPESGKVRNGVLSQKMLSNEHTLVLGNELLSMVDKDYPRQQIREVRQHTVSSVINILSIANVKAPIGYSDAPLTQGCDVIAGYIIFDALISNTDRHHENWGIVIIEKDQFYLSPSYDHASSLGRNEPLKKKKIRLTTKDKNYTVESYAEKAKSAFYPNSNSKNLQTCRDAAKAAIKINKNAKAWINKISGITDQDFKNILSEVPDTIINDIDREFALKMLISNRDYLSTLL
jgi:hypothetical protein